MAMAPCIQASVLAFVVAAGAAQEPALGKQPRLTLAVVTIESGKQVPRIPEPAPGEPPCSAFTMVGRVIEWRLGDLRVRDLPTLSDAIRNVAAAVEGRRTAKDRAENAASLPLAVTFDDRVRWIEVVRTLDVLHQVGVLTALHCMHRPEFEPQFEACAVHDPVSANGAHVVPRALFCEPIETSLKFRPVFKVDQGGRVEFEGVTVRDPKAPDGGKALTAALASCSKRDDDGFGTRRFGEQQLELSNNYLLIHADAWAPWPVVREIGLLATQVRPALYQLRYAVGEHDYEERLRAGERFAAAPAGDGKDAPR